MYKRQVLFIVDAIGLRPRIEEMADRIASWGYTVLAPHVFYRNGAADDLAPTSDLREPQHRSFPKVAQDGMPKICIADSAVSMPSASPSRPPRGIARRTAPCCRLPSARLGRSKPARRLVLASRNVR